ncbi:MAG: hypothetical protein F6J95_023850 [Leptolyngbya sp. SIO1E4]|nr:hypothetical protein [Leptolyngbya sp. SIO1E4]
MTNQGLRLALAGGLGIASLGIAISSPTLTDVTADDLAAFANGERVEITSYRPNRLLAGSLGVLGLGVLGWWARKELVEGQAPIVEGLASTETSQVSERRVIKAPAGVPAPERYVDVSAVLARRLRPTLITGNPRTGKGIAVAAAIQRLKAEQPEVSIWLIQPKYHPKEHAYWELCDRHHGFMLEDYAGLESEAAEHCQEMERLIREWRKQGREEDVKTVLIIDELSLIKAILPRWYKDFLISQLITEMSSGETSDRALWAITQSPLAQDVGLSGGDRAPFDLLAIETPTSKEHLHSLSRSYAGVPLPEDDIIYRQSLTPKKAVFYHSAYDEWLPMLKYHVPGQAEVREVGGSWRGSRGSRYGESGSGAERVLTSATSQLPEGVDLRDLLAVSQALVRGDTSTQIVEDTLGFKGRKFEEGKNLFNKIKTFIEEYS